MRILILVDCYYPSSKSGAKLIHDLAAELLRQGNAVIVATPSEFAKNALELSVEEGLLIARIKTGRIKGASKVLRGLREVRLSVTLWRKGRNFFLRHPCELIVFYSPTIFFGALVRKLKSLWGCPAYLILRDIFPQWAVDAGVLRRGSGYRFLRTKELDQYAAADIIGVQSPANLEYFARQLPGNDYNLEVLYNWMSLEESNCPYSSYRSQLGLQDKVVFFYGGNIGTAQDMDNIIRLAWNLRSEPHICFLLVGDGSEVERLKALIQERSLTNIGLLPAVGQAEYLTMLSEFDVGLVSLDRRLQTQNFPGKVLGYMHASLPILASLNPGNDLKDLLEERNAGLCCINGDDEAFQNHALALARDADLRRTHGQNARRLLEHHFSVTSAVKQILAHFQKPPAFSCEAGGARWSPS
ncbi:MAG: glycosyltransferase family 4 protein [Acidobacteria bacterium]|nr:glycosyltransferase family 4 protein [Acidobacteriota bacterium]MCI0719212.1 glycosyltransferase family 4 protein [Acidobacteriota bacterium]